jgi:hypothetical protein
VGGAGGGTGATSGARAVTAGTGGALFADEHAAKTTRTHRICHPTRERAYLFRCVCDSSLSGCDVVAKPVVALAMSCQRGVVVASLPLVERTL